MSNLIPRNHQENYYLSKIVADLDWTAIEENSSAASWILTTGTRTDLFGYSAPGTRRKATWNRDASDIGKLTKLRT